MYEAATILLIESDRDVAKGAARWLVAAGHNVLVARNGRDGIGLANDARPDLIVLDTRVPPVCGRTILSSIRDHPSTAIIPLVIFTTHRQTRLFQRLLKVGVRFFAAKPYEPSCLLRTVRAALSRSLAVNSLSGKRSDAVEGARPRRRIDAESEQTQGPTAWTSTGDPFGAVPLRRTSLDRRGCADLTNSRKKLAKE